MGGGRIIEFQLLAGSFDLRIQAWVLPQLHQWFLELDKGATKSNLGQERRVRTYRALVQEGTLR